MSFQFSDQQRNTLDLICETINPSLQPELPSDEQAIFENHAGKYPVVDELEKRVAKKPESQHAALTRLLRIINVPIVCWFATNKLRPFNSLTLDQRAQVLAHWRDHRDGKLRSFFQLVKRLTLFFSYTHSDSQDQPNCKNASWQAIGYEGVTPLTAQPELEINFAKLEANTQEIECDYLIIGSGAGGSVMAAELAERNCRIIIAEKADYAPPSEYGNSEFEGMAKHFEDGGTLATSDLGVSILAGSSVGGGTAVNWMTCLDPPEPVLKDWADQFGFSDVLDERFQTSLKAVRKRLNVSTEHSQHNQQNQKLLEGCQQLGFKTQQIHRNAKGCGDCGYCGFGCRAGAKQDTRQTFLADAMRLGAELLPSCTIERIVRDGKVATHAIAHIRAAGGQTRTLKIKFKTCVVACGSINTPALLLRSGFENSHIGQNLKLHPTTAVVGFYDHPILPWKGAPQTIVSDEFSNLDGNDFGVRLETAPLHPGLGASALAWRDPLHNKRLLQQLGNSANTIVIARDRGSGAVVLDENQRVQIQYSLSKIDQEHLLLGAARAVEIHRAAGADLILGPHQTPLEFKKEMSDEAFKRALGQINQLGGDPNRLTLFSAHQMSSARIADSPEHGAVDLQGKSYDADNVYVCDASIFPTAVGVNPMITIMGLSHLLAQSLKARA